MTSNMEYIRKMLGTKDTPEVYPDMTPPDIQPCLKGRPTKLLRSIGKKGSRNGYFNSSCGITVTRQGIIIVADTENHRLQLFHPDGQLKSTIGERGSRPHQLNHPMCVTLTPDLTQNIMVTDSVNDCVTVFRQDGSFVAQYTECGDFPYGIAVTSDYYMVTSDLCKHCIVVLHPSGNRHHQFGEEELNHPYFITCNKQDNIIVSDSGNSVIKMFHLDGSLLRSFLLTDFRLVTEDFILLQGVTTDASGNLLIIGNSAVFICANNGRLWEVVLPEDGLHTPKCLAFCDSGKLVVTQCGYDNRHEVSVFAYNMDDFKSLRIGPLSYSKKRKVGSLSLETSVDDSQMSHSAMSCSDT